MTLRVKTVREDGLFLSSPSDVGAARSERSMCDVQNFCGFEAIPGRKYE